jgi:hypothetical protein
LFKAARPSLAPTMRNAPALRRAPHPGYAPTGKANLSSGKHGGKPKRAPSIKGSAHVINEQLRPPVSVKWHIVLPDEQRAELSRLADRTGASDGRL